MKDPAPRRRLNPFVFPAETQLRFSLLIAAALALAWLMGSYFIAVVIPLLGLPAQYEWAMDFFMESLQGGFAEPALGREGAAAALQGQVDHLGAILVKAIPETVLLGAFFVMVFGAAGWSYRLHPQRLRRRYQLSPVRSEENKNFLAEVQRLAAMAGVTRMPSIEMQRGSTGADGQAFGLRGRYAIRLGGRMPLLLAKSPQRFAAIVLHELAHIINRDIGATYFTQSLWIAVAVLAIGGWLTFYYGMAGFNIVQGLIRDGLSGVHWGHFFTVILPSLFGNTLRAGFLLLLIWLVRNSLLRVRELYADWRADVWGAGAALQEIFGAAVASAAAGAKAKPVRFWRSWLQLHPTAAERLHVLGDSGVLFRASASLAFLVGVLTGIGLTATPVLGIVLYGIFRVGGLLLYYTGLRVSLQIFGAPPQPILSFFRFILGQAIPDLVVLALVFAITYLIAGTLGVQIQREAVHDAARGVLEGGYRRLWRYALAIEIGLEVGLILPPLNYLAPHGIANLLFFPFGVVLWSGVFWCWLAYARFFTLRITTVPIRMTAPHGWRRLLTWISTAQAGWVFVIIVLTRLALYALAQPEFATDLAIFGDPLAAVALLISLSLGAMATIIALAFGVTWAYGRLLLNSARSRCPGCKQPAPAGAAVGRFCSRCGESLAPWLYV